MANGENTDEAKQKKINEAIEEMNKKLEKAKKLQKEIVAEKERMHDLETSEYDRFVKLSQLEQQRLEATKEALLAQIESGNLTEAILNNTDEFVKLQEQAKDLGIDLTEIQRNINEGGMEEHELIEMITQATNEKVNAQKKSEQAIKNMEKLQGGLLNKLGLQSDINKTISGQMGKQLDSLIHMDLSFKEIVEVGASQFEGIMFSIVDQVFQMALGMDKASKAFGSATGFGNVMADDMMAVYDATVGTGATMEDASNAMATLANNFSGFDVSAKGANRQMAQTIVLLEKVGVGGAEAAKTMDFFTKALGMTGPAAANVTRELAMMGRAMGVTASKMISDFQSVSGDISIYGGRTTQVFKNLAAQAKETGLEINTLVGLGKKFDTFDGAADSASKLNAVLGTQISAIDMMNMSYDDRIKYLKSELQQVGANVNSMDPYTQQYITQAMGLNSVAEMQRLVNMSQAEVDANAQKQAEANKRQEELLKLTTSLVPFTDQLKIAMTQLVLELRPLIMSFVELMKFMSENQGLIKGLIIAYGSYVAIAKAANVVNAILYAWGMKIKIQEELKAIRLAGTNSLQGISTALQAKEIPVKWANFAATIANAKATTAFGVALKFAMGPLGILLTILVALGAWFLMRGSPQMYTMFGFIALGVIAFGVALYFIQGPAQMSLGLIVGLGIAMAVMFYSLNLVIQAIGGLFSLLIDNVSALPEVASGIFIIAGSVGALGIAAALSLGAIFLLMGAISGIGAVVVGGLLVGGIGMLMGLGDSMEKIGGGMTNFASGLSQVKSIASEMAGVAEKGFLAVSSDGASTNMVMGSSEVMAAFSDGRVTVDVNIPEMKIPETVVNVYLDGTKMEGFVKKVINRR